MSSRVEFSISLETIFNLQLREARVEVIQNIERSQVDIQRQTLERLEELNVNINEIHQVQIQQAAQQEAQAIAIAELQIAQAEQVIQQANAIEEIHQLRTALEQIAELIGQRILLPDRIRPLQVYAGRENRPYVNLDRRRHYLNEDEARFAIQHH